MGLLVVGMHRSGTSAVGRTLDALGLPTGPENQLIGPDAGNRLGHWEVRPITDLNDEILAAVGCHWAAPDDLDPERLRELARGRLGERAQALVGALLPGRRWFVKDPRLSLLLPFWNELLGTDVAVVHVTRHPVEVAGSLVTRNSIHPEVGRALWERYTRRALLDGSDAASHVVSYERLLDAPAATVDALARFLEANDLVDRAQPGAAQAISADERHHTHARGGRDVLSSEQCQLLDLVTAAVGGPAPEAGLVPDETPGLAFAFRAGADVARIWRAELSRLESEVVHARDTAQVEIDAIHVELASVRRSAQSEIDCLSAETERLAVDGDHLAAQLNQARAGLRAARRASAARANLEATTRDLRLALADARSEASQIPGLVAALHDVEQRLAAEIGSNSHQAITMYRRVAGRILPPPTRRGRAYRRTMGVARRGASTAIWQAERIRAKRAARRGPDPAVWPPGVDMDTSDSPLASIVIPVYGEWEVTRHCLVSIAEHTTVPYEVIVVDDASPDDTPAFLDHSSGIEVVTNRPNLGYLRSTNAGAERARGQILVLLNNDTEVTPGWLDSLVATFDRGDDVGVVGAKLVYPTGELQEAGAILWSDGSGWNYGRGEHPDRFSYEYVREVDYCSAACVAVRHDLWKHLGGFDERYTPAYYEDADLAFRARRAGFRVLYQPGARVIHHEGLSHGTDESSGVKANQLRNRARFVDTWSRELSRQQLPDPGRVRRAADRRTGLSVLVVDHQVPAPDRDAGSLRMAQLLEFLADSGHRVRFVPANHFRNPPYDEPLRQMGVEVVYGDFDPLGYLEEIGYDVDVAILSRPLVAVNWMPLLREWVPHCRIVYDMVDSHGLREERRADVTGSNAAVHQADMLGDLESLLVRTADLTFAISDPERDDLAIRCPEADVVTVPTVHDRHPSPTRFEDRSGLLFVGSWAHPPNRDAIEWLASELAPRLRSRLPGTLVHIVGSDVPGGIAEQAPDIVVHGWLPDIDPIFDEVRLSIAPLRYGAGLKGKVGDSIARGVPIVTTSVGAEGFGFSSSFELDVADTADGFVDAVVSLYNDRDRWIAQREAGRTAIIEELGRDAVRERLASHLAALTDPGGTEPE